MNKLFEKVLNEGTWAFTKPAAEELNAALDELRSKYFDQVGDDVLWDKIDAAQLRIQQLKHSFEGKVSKKRKAPTTESILVAEKTEFLEEVNRLMENETDPFYKQQILEECAKDYGLDTWQARELWLGRND